MERFSSLISSGIRKVWEVDAESQYKFLDVIASARNTSVRLLQDVGAFFVPNGKYLIKYFSPEIQDPDLDCYSYSGVCKWQNNLVIPIYDLADEIVGLGGFNPFLYAKAHEPDGSSENYYQYSSSRIFKKGNYLYCPKGVQERAMREGYVVVTDGIFDAITLVGAGFNAASLMGSGVTPEIVVQLRMVGKTVLACDNDDAGLRLKEKLKHAVKNTVEFTQGKTKDIDGLLNSGYHDRAVRALWGVINGGSALRARL